MAKMVLNKVGNIIVNVLKKSSRPLSTYEIAKLANISWATANTYCYKLKSFDFMDCKNEEVKVGVKRIIWWLK